MLYAGVALFVVLAALTTRSIWMAWRERSGEARAEAIFELVEQRMPPRPTDAPGAMAWLRLELMQFSRHLADPDRARRYRSFAAASERVPDELQDVLAALRRGAESPADPTRIRSIGASASGVSDSLRQQRRLAFDNHTFIVTRRRALDTPELTTATPSNRFIATVVPMLADARRDIARAIDARPLAPVPAGRPPRPVRVYAVSEDGTLVSTPWEESGDAADRELVRLSARPALPTLAPAEFFFRFGAGDARDQAAYSGFYLDVGGRGLVSTVTLPAPVVEGERGVMALDLAFDVDWRSFASVVDPPVAGAAVTIPDASRASWATLDAALGADAPPAQRTAVDALASEERRTGSTEPPSPLRHGLVQDTGAVAAFQVSEATWLVMLFPKTAPAFPIAAVGLLAGLLTVLFAGFEFNRRRAEGERVNAERALAEKQNLLNTMQVPLVVVDPNTDVIVSSNRAAESIGIHGGSRFADLVWPEKRARAHYDRMQAASAEPRRAYGVPVAVRDEHGRIAERYAIVRSVAVTAPIAALSADQRHRLGILFVLEPEDDLALLVSRIDERAHTDERRRLAGLLSHGVDTLARVLEHCFARREDGGSEFTAWLAEYLERRLTVTAWLLDHWDAAPPLPRDSVVDVEQARATFTRLDQVYRRVRDDRELRSRLHWNNGTLAAASPNGDVIAVDLDWPPSFECTTPVRGGFGLFVGEVLANAVRHGAPGTVPRVSVACDRVRKELAFAVENDTSGPAPAAQAQGESYGGVAILTAMARLFEWRDLTFQADGARFVVTWRVPVSERGAPGKAD